MSTWKNNNWNNENDIGRVLKGTTIFVKNNDVNKAMRKLKKRLQDEGIFNELRKREYYEKPSKKNRLERSAAAVRERKRQSQWKSDQ